MSRHAFFACVLASGLSAAAWGCGRTEKEPEPTAAKAVASPVVSQLFGAPLSLETPSKLADVLAFPEPVAGKTVLVEGAVRRACSKKGCWLELATENSATAPSCRVTFKDYAFFVPTNSAGSRARIQGVIEVQEMSRAHVDHLEAEGAHFDDKAPDGTVQEVRLVATGVELSRG